MTTVTKKDLLDQVADQTGQKRVAVKETVQALLDQIARELGKGNRLEIRDFGVFEIKNRAPRVAQNPKTLEPVIVPAKRTVKFKVGRMMRTMVENGGAPGDSPAAEDSSPLTVATRVRQPHGQIRAR